MSVKSGRTADVEVLVVEPNGVMRRGFEASLLHAAGVGGVTAVAGPEEAWQTPAVGEAGFVLLNIRTDGALDFIARLEEFGCPRVAVFGREADRDLLAAALEAGAHAAIDEAVLSPQTTVLVVHAVLAGQSFSLSGLFRSGGTAVAPQAPPPPLSDREQRVLALVADGLPTREVALEMAYSERTVKKVLGDVVVKLGARSRSQAIASAVRYGII